MCKDVVPIDLCRDAAPIHLYCDAAPIHLYCDAAPIDLCRDAAPIDMYMGVAPIDLRTGAAPIELYRDVSPIGLYRDAVPIDLCRDAAPIDLCRDAAPIDLCRDVALTDLCWDTTPTDLRSNATHDASGVAPAGGGESPGARLFTGPRPAPNHRSIPRLSPARSLGVSGCVLLHTARAQRCVPGQARLGHWRTKFRSLMGGAGFTPSASSVKREIRQQVYGLSYVRRASRVVLLVTSMRQLDQCVRCSDVKHGASSVNPACLPSLLLSLQAEALQWKCWTWTQKARREGH